MLFALVSGTVLHYLSGGRLRLLNGFLASSIQAIQSINDQSGLFPRRGSGALSELRASRDRIWREADAHYHVSDWGMTVDCLERADEIEDTAAGTIGLDPLATRIVGRQITGSIGHMSFGLALRARMALLGENPVNSYWVLGGQSANAQYLEYWRRYFEIVDISASEGAALEWALWPILESIQTVRTTGGSRDLVSAHNNFAMQWDQEGRPPLLELLPEDKRRGDEYLRSRGVEPGAFVVTLHVRENTQDRSGYGRNADISTYMPAIREIINRGGTVFRLGNSSMTPIKERGVVDLAHSEPKPPWLDPYLIASSRFMIATTSGPIGVAPSFGIPLLWTNAPDIGKAVFHGRSLMLPKLVRNPSGELMSLAEMLASPVGWSDAYLDSFSDEAGRHGYQWVDNSPEDLVAGVHEMLGAWCSAESIRQREWRRLLAEAGSTGSTRISESFVEAHALSLGLVL